MEQQPAPAASELAHELGEPSIASVVSRLFSDIRHDVDSIVSSAEAEVDAADEDAEAAVAVPAAAAAAPAGQAGQAGPAPQPQPQPGAAADDAGAAAAALEAQQLPALQLHGRTLSEAVEHDDYALPEPLARLPEALLTLPGTEGGEPDAATTPSRLQPTPVTPTAQLAAAHAASPRSASVPALLQSAPAALWAVSADAALSVVSSAQRQLSYKELLNRALSYTPPKPRAAASPHAARPEAPLADRPRPWSTSAASSAAASRRTSTASSVPSLRAPSSAPAAAGAGCSPAGAIRWPASTALTRLPLGGSLRPGGKPARQQPQSKFPATRRVPTASTGAGGAACGTRNAKAWGRSHSAPREAAAASRHVQRMGASPVRASLLQAQAAQQPQQRAKSNPREARAATERLYSLGVEKQTKRVQTNVQREPSPVRLTEGEWSRVSRRLFSEAAMKEERQRQRREAHELAYAAATNQHSPCLTPNCRSRSASPTAVERAAASSSGGSEGAAAGSAAFYERQAALLQKRANTAAKRRPLDEQELQECTFHPEINASSRHLQRSVQALHKWDVQRRLHVYEMALDKCGREFDGYTFAPLINPLSRRLALSSYAAAPDPARPWTRSPTHTRSPPGASPRSCPSPEALQLLRNALPPAALLQMAEPDQPHSTSSWPESASLLTAPAGRPGQRSSPQRVRSSVPCLWTEPLPVTAEQSMRLEQVLSAATAASDAPRRSPQGRGRHAKAAEPAPAQHAPQPRVPASVGGSAPLPPGTVLGIPVPFVPPPAAAALPAAAAAAAVPQDAVIIHMPLSPAAPAAFSPEQQAAKLAGQPGLAAARSEAGTPGAPRPAVPAQLGLEAGLGPASASSSGGGSASAAEELLGRRLKCHTASKGRVSRDDSAGGMYAPATQARKQLSSSGGAAACFCPVTSAHGPAKQQLVPSSPLSKAHDGADVRAGGLPQPMLEPATCCFVAGSTGQASPAGGRMGVRTSYSQRFKAAKAAAAPAQPCTGTVDCGGTAGSAAGDQAADEGSEPAGQLAPSFAALKASWEERQSAGGGPAAKPAGASADARLSGSGSFAPGTPVLQQLQQPFGRPLGSSVDGGMALLKQYSTAQLLNAAQRHSMGGAGRSSCPGAAPGAAADGGQAASHGGGPAASPRSVPPAVLPQLQLLEGLGSAPLLPDASSSSPVMADASSGAAQLSATRTEGLLEQTRSVPFELLVSPRSRIFLGTACPAAGPNAPPSEQLLAVLSQAAADGGSMHAGSGSELDAAATSSAAAGRAAALAADVSAVNAVAQLLSTSPAGWARVGPPSPQGQAGSNAVLMHSFLQSVAASPHLPDSRLASSLGTQTSGLREAPAHTGGSSLGTDSHSSAPAGAQQQQPQQQAGAAAQQASTDERDEASISASELAAMLFDATLSPEQKAARVAHSFRKTLSKLNMPAGALQATLAAFGPQAAAPAAAVGAAAVAAPVPTPDASRAASAEGSACSCDDGLTGEAENIQQLLQRMEAEAAPVQGQQLPEQHEQASLPADRVLQQAHEHQAQQQQEEQQQQEQQEEEQQEKQEEQPPQHRSYAVVAAAAAETGAPSHDASC